MILLLHLTTSNYLVSNNFELFIDKNKQNIILVSKGVGMFGATLSAIDDALLRQSVSAYNVANLNTNGFSEKEVVSTDKRFSIQDSIVTNKSNPNNLDLAKQIVNSNLSVVELGANVAQLKAQNKMIGSLLNINT